MADPLLTVPVQNEEALRAEITRLNKIIQALMNRAERSMSLQGSDFNLFQLAIVLEDQVRQRTEDVEAALREVQTLQSKLHEQALRDPLTGFYNRRYLTEAFDRELLRAERYARSVSVIMGDLDHFKAVNDTYGHRAGDAVIKAFCELLQRNARGSDIYCRYGGEEFLMVLFDMTGGDAYQRAEQWRLAFAALPIHCDASVIRATASFGIAAFPMHGKTGDALIAAADAALYAAKHDGRNRVKRYDTQMFGNM
jgi:diguanylate cyclase (GGDEF)-like protein